MTHVLCGFCDRKSRKSKKTFHHGGSAEPRSQRPPDNPDLTDSIFKTTRVCLLVLLSLYRRMCSVLRTLVLSSPGSPAAFCGAVRMTQQRGLFATSEAAVSREPLLCMISMAWGAEASKGALTKEQLADQVRMYAQTHANSARADTRIVTKRQTRLCRKQPTPDLTC